jgi:hypothetical protein
MPGQPDLRRHERALEPSGACEEMRPLKHHAGGGGIVRGARLLHRHAGDVLTTRGRAICIQKRAPGSNALKRDPYRGLATVRQGANHQHRDGLYNAPPMKIRELYICLPLGGRRVYGDALKKVRGIKLLGSKFSAGEMRSITPPWRDPTLQ